MIEEICVSIDESLFYSRYNMYNGDSSEFTSALENHLEAIYPDASVDVELNHVPETSIWIDNKDTHNLVPPIQAHIDDWLMKSVL